MLGVDDGRSTKMAITLQRRWTWCSKCGNLWYSGAGSQCVAAKKADGTFGPHTGKPGSGSGDYALIHHPTKVELT